MCLGRGCGCISSLIVGMIVGLLVLLLAAGYVASRKLASEQPLIGVEEPWTQPQQVVLEGKLAVSRKIKEVRDKKEQTLILSERELNHLINQHLPKRLNGARLRLELAGDNHVTIYFAQPVRKRWLNIKGQGLLSAENGQFNVDLDSIRMGQWNLPTSARAQLSGWLKSLLISGRWIGYPDWKIKTMKTNKLGATVTIEQI